MKLKLNKFFAANTKVDEYDTRAMKRILNRLGYYMPPKEFGSTHIPDRAVFEALKNFQKDNNLLISGELRPGDDTEKALNEAVKNQDPNAEYIWHTKQDDKVRSSHAARQDQIFTWGNPPGGGHPKEDHGCRCWAENITGIVPNERERNRICIDLDKKHNELKEEIKNTIPKKIETLERLIISAKEELEKWKEQEALAKIPNVPRLKSRKKLPFDLDDAFDIFGLQKQIENIHKIQRKIRDVENRIRSMKNEIERLQKRESQALQELYDVEEQIKLLCSRA